MEKVIAIDFDGTLFQDAWPDIGSPNIGVINQAIKEQNNGARLVLWTCREGDLLIDAIMACETYGLVFDAINDSIPSWKAKFGTNPRKIGATEYWDDKAYNPHRNGLNIWQLGKHGNYQCPVCKVDGIELASKFCPHCGARMFLLI